jgi:hypothetical protein
MLLLLLLLLLKLLALDALPAPGCDCPCADDRFVFCTVANCTTRVCMPSAQ